MVDNISFRSGDCTVKDEKIECDLGSMLTNPDMTVEIDMSSKIASVEVENEDVEFYSNTRSDVVLEGGMQSDEILVDGERIRRSFKNNKIVQE